MIEVDITVGYETPSSDQYSEQHWHGLLRWETERRTALILLLSAVFASALGICLSLPYWNPPLSVSPWLYGSWSILSALVGVGLLTWPALRRYQPTLMAVLMVSAYLVVVALAFMNGLATVMLGLLILAQLLLALTFRHWVEFALFALVSLGVCFFCSNSLPELKVAPFPLLLLMGAATAGAGLFLWWRSGRIDLETPADELVGHLMDQDEAALFLLDYDGVRIIFQNHAAALLLDWLGLATDAEGSDILAALNLERTYLTNRMGVSQPGRPEKQYITRRADDGEERRFELVVSKLPIPETPYLRLKITDITERVHREHQVRRSLSINESLLQAIPDVLITLDAEDRVIGLRMPRRVSSWLKRERYVTQPVQVMIDDMLDEKGKGAIRDLITTARRQGGLHSSEFDLIKGRHTFHFEVRVMRINQREELLGMIRDITFGKRAELALRRSENNYRQIFNTGAEGIIVLDLEQFHPIDVNHEARRLLGYQPEDLARYSISDLVPPHDFARFTDHLAKATDDDPQRLSMNLICENEEELPVEMDLKISQIDGQERLLMVFRDIGERIASRRELEESEKRYRTLVENMNEGLLLTDVEERILFANQRIMRMFGLTESQVLGLNTYQLLGNGSNDAVIAAKNKLRREGVSDKYELQIQRRNGDILWLFVTGSPYVDADGNVVGTIAIITDITDRKQTELKLQEKNGELDAFVYKASHDLRGPLTSIIGVTNIARTETEDDSALRYFDLINKSTKRLDLILSELLDVTRMNKAKVFPEPIQLSQLVDEIFHSLSHLFSAGTVTLFAELDVPDLINYDRRMLTSIIQNLVVNSINYRNRERDDAKVEVKAYVVEERLYIEVLDNGVGIPERIQPKIFEMFYRGNNKSKGSGLGLYIVKSAAEKLGGRISFTSEEGVGSTFTLTLPLRMAEPVPDSQTDVQRHA